VVVVFVSNGRNQDTDSTYLGSGDHGCVLSIAPTVTAGLIYSYTYEFFLRDREGREGHGQGHIRTIKIILFFFSETKQSYYMAMAGKSLKEATRMVWPFHLSNDGTEIARDFFFLYPDDGLAGSMR
jgi:hypothetical protein